jgi:hypothetical protein
MIMIMKLQFLLSLPRGYRAGAAAEVWSSYSSVRRAGLPWVPVGTVITRR